MYLVVPPGGCFPEMRRIELGPGPLTIGRSESCEIRVDVPGVDQEHAKISEVALVALGPDCAIGDVPLDSGARRLVMPGDEIQIGSMIVALEGDDPSAVAEGAILTRRLGSPHHDGPRVRIVEGTNFGDELLLKEENREYVLGRGPNCDLVVEDREVSREHVKLVRRGYSIFIKDLSSTRGSWLGRSAVYTGATVEWTRPRMLRLGATVLSLELPQAIRRAARGAMAAMASAPMTPPSRSRSNSPSPRMPPASPSSAAASARGSSTMPAPSEPPPGSAAAAIVAAEPGSSPRPLGTLPPPSQARKAWKKTGPTIGKASGLLLLALAGLAILGALFVVFSLLE